VNQIKSWNNLRGNNLNIGQKLIIYPKRLDAVVNNSPKSSPSKKASTAQNSEFYKVKPGDSLWSISKKYPGLSVEDLKSINKLKDNKLKPGMKLKVSKG
jgi:membrane-bound lytic murein transglycosylase D